MGKTFRRNDNYHSNKTFKDRNFKQSNKFKKLKVPKKTPKVASEQPELSTDDFESLS